MRTSQYNADRYELMDVANELIVQGISRLFFTSKEVIRNGPTLNQVIPVKSFNSSIVVINPGLAEEILNINEGEKK